MLHFTLVNLTWGTKFMSISNTWAGRQYLWFAACRFPNNTYILH